MAFLVKLAHVFFLPILHAARNKRPSILLILSIHEFLFFHKSCVHGLETVWIFLFFFFQKLIINEIQICYENSVGIEIPQILLFFFCASKISAWKSVFFFLCCWFQSKVSPKDLFFFKLTMKMLCYWNSFYPNSSLPKLCGYENPTFFFVPWKFLPEDLL